MSEQKKKFKLELEIEELERQIDPISLCSSDPQYNCCGGGGVYCIK